MISILGQREPTPELEPKPPLFPKPDTVPVTLSRWWMLFPGIALIGIGVLVFAYAIASNQDIGIGSVAYGAILMLISWVVGGFGILLVLIDIALRVINRRFPEVAK